MSASAPSTTPPTTTTTKRKSPSSSTTPAPKTIHFTARNPQWTYLKLQLVPQPNTPSTTQPLDPLTARTYLSAALTQFLGLTGTAIPIDILKISSDESEPEPGSPTISKIVWVRVPRDDASAVVAALSSWIGGSTGGDSSAGNVAWRVCAKGNYLGALVQGSGSDLFVS
ncbi:hypothetical protein BO71DRAFT_343780 [Aspergillus ellipticus CBS 707.79]|uniref:Ribonucleases P/MRP subunit Pop8-like domain-containing protein n=1 Tax=Aspergillus ellipticus CBS 707.79 TaxID=1448320 RepID=A0A319DMX0_9EURO|nr:hypothetical protein BO71DRAFT_343780 [Aspergillus ellipticus CBS 707.79]